MEYTLNDVVVGDGGDTIVLRWTMTGTHAGEYQGVEPTDETIETEGLEINKFEGGTVLIFSRIQSQPGNTVTR